MRKAISIIGMILTLFAAAGCEKWAMALRAKFSADFNTVAYLWNAGLIALFLASVLVTLTWYVLVWCPRSKLVSIIYLIAGLMFTFLLAFQVTFSSVLPSFGIEEMLLPSSRLLFTGASIAVIGLAGMVFPRHS